MNRAIVGTPDVTSTWVVVASRSSPTRPSHPCLSNQVDRPPALDCSQSFFYFVPQESHRKAGLSNLISAALDPFAFLAKFDRLVSLQVGSLEQKGWLRIDASYCPRLKKGFCSRDITGRRGKADEGGGEEVGDDERAGLGSSKRFANEPARGRRHKKARRPEEIDQSALLHL